MQKLMKTSSNLHILDVGKFILNNSPGVKNELSPTALNLLICLCLCVIIIDGRPLLRTINQTLSRMHHFLLFRYEIFVNFFVDSGGWAWALFSSSLVVVAYQFVFLIITIEQQEFGFEKIDSNSRWMRMDGSDVGGVRMSISVVPSKRWFLSLSMRRG